MTPNSFIGERSFNDAVGVKNNTLHVEEGYDVPEAFGLAFDQLEQRRAFEVIKSQCRDRALLSGRQATAPECSRCRGVALDCWHAAIAADISRLGYSPRLVGDGDVGAALPQA